MTIRFLDFLSRLRKSDPDRARFAAILGLNRQLAAAADRRAVLQLLLDEAVELFRAERGFLVEIDDRPEAAQPMRRIALARNLDREPVRNPQAKVSSTIVAQALASREGVFVEDAQEGALGAAQSVADMHLRSVLCIPLIAGSRCYGCLYLDHRFHTSVFRAEDLPWAQALADQGAIALRTFDLLEVEAEQKRLALAEKDRIAATLVEREDELLRISGEFERAGLDHEYPEIVGESPALVRMLRMIERVAVTDFSIMLAGESGSGKELAARAIWEHGRRGESGPFVPVNVAAISPALLESELFGHVTGAFTGADADREGLIRHAAGGVLFLDECTEMPLEMQVKLLRFLEDHRVRPVGSDEVHEVDLRVIAATNRDPGRAVAEGVLREDLYYRLATVTISVPPLRERLADIPLLVGAFLRDAAAQRAGGAVAPASRQPREATDALLTALRRQSWPGNVRQLRNEVLRLDALASDDEWVDVDDLTRLAAEAASAATSRRQAAATTLDLREHEQWAILEAMRITGGNKAEAARLLGISRRALYNKLARAPDLDEA